MPKAVLVQIENFHILSYCETQNLSGLCYTEDYPSGFLAQGKGKSKTEKYLACGQGCSGG